MAIWDNDLISIVKYADNTTLLIKACKNEIDLSQEVVNHFFRWNLACHPKKCNELILCEKVAHDIDPVNNVTQVCCLKVIGVTLQSNHRFTEHIEVKLQEANKCLYVIRCLRFRSIVLSKLRYSLPVY